MSERVIYAEDAGTGNSFRLIAAGKVDQNALSALEGYIARQRDRLLAERVVGFPLGPWRLWAQK